MATVVSISTNGLKGNVAYASNKFINVGEYGNNPAVMSKEDTEKFKAEFAYEMAQITAKIVSAPTTNVENFKVEFAYATAKVTAKVMPMIPGAQRNEFAYEMAQITSKIISDPKLDIEKAKAEFAYEIAQLTTKVITNADTIAIDRTMRKGNNADIEPKATGKVSSTDPNTALLRNNVDIERKATDKVDNTGTGQKAVVNPGYIAPEVYNGLIDELTKVGDRGNHVDKTVHMDGQIRYHYADNSGSGTLGRDAAGFNARLGFDTDINKDWHAYGMLEGKKNIVNYDNEFKLSRLYAVGKLGDSNVRAGSFGYLMAEGNIYDSGFTGVRFDFGEPVKYTFSYGETDYTKETYIATARYEDFDYNLEAGVYHYQTDDGVNNRNTIRTFGGTYNFSNFGVGAMVLGSSLKDSEGDSNGYVFSLNYGDLKTWRPGTYNVFAKYYNQPVGTYIDHGMNGRGGSMQGFKGYGIGTRYTLTQNVVAGLEYYDLTDKISGEKGKTWWSELTRYF